MNEIEAHFIETRENWWSALGDDDRAMMVGCADADGIALPDAAVQIIVTAKSPAALAAHVAWQGQTGSWTLTEAGRSFLLIQRLDT